MSTHLTIRHAQPSTSRPPLPSSCRCPVQHTDCHACSRHVARPWCSQWQRCTNRVYSSYRRALTQVKAARSASSSTCSRREVRAICSALPVTVSISQVYFMLAPSRCTAFCLLTIVAGHSSSRPVASKATCSWRVRRRASRSSSILADSCCRDSPSRLASNNLRQPQWVC